jgi:hypothetical protein
VNGRDFRRYLQYYNEQVTKLARELTQGKIGVDEWRNQMEQQILANQIVDDMLGLGPIEPLLHDEAITDIMINGPYQIYVEKKGKLQLTDIMDAKAILGDVQSALRVMVMHSKAWLSAKKDIVTGSNYNIERIGDMVVMGGIPGLEGMTVILCDDGTKVAGASAGADAYYTFLLGEGVVSVTPAPNSPLFTAVQSLGKGVRSTKVSIEDHYALNLKSVAMTTDAAGNPTAAELYDTTNWGEAFSHDHRDFKAVYIKTYNG